MRCLFAMGRRIFGPPPGIGDTIVQVAHGRARRLNYSPGLFGRVMGAAFGRHQGALQGSVGPVLNGSYPLARSTLFGGQPRRLSIRRFVRLAGRIRRTLGIPVRPISRVRGPWEAGQVVKLGWRDEGYGVRGLSSLLLRRIGWNYGCRQEVR